MITWIRIQLGSVALGDNRFSEPHISYFVLFSLLIPFPSLSCFRDLVKQPRRAPPALHPPSHCRSLPEERGRWLPIISIIHLRSHLTSRESQTHLTHSSRTRDLLSGDIVPPKEASLIILLCLVLVVRAQCNTSWNPIGVVKHVGTMVEDLLCGCA